MNRLTRSVVIFILIVIVFAFLFEFLCQLTIRIKTGEWLFKKEIPYHTKLFRRHSWLVGSPIPKATYKKGKLVFSHNLLGFRGSELGKEKKKGTIRVVCYGGSSTYGFGVSDNQTWPACLAELLGPQYEIVNAGVPGYTTAEAVIQTALQQYDLKPDISLYYEGWNDLRNINLDHLESDYSGFHGASQFHNLALDELKIGVESAAFKIFSPFLKQVFFAELPLTIRGNINGSQYQRALEIYEFNLKTLASLSKSRGVRSIMIPQIVNYDLLTAETSKGWLPFVRDKDVKKFLPLFHKSMLDVCKEKNIECLSSVLESEWHQEDFLDEVHFTVAGNKKLASIIAGAIDKRFDK